MAAAMAVPLSRHHRYYDFLDYGDARGYRRSLEAIRERLAEKKKKPDGL